MPRLRLAIRLPATSSFDFDTAHISNPHSKCYLLRMRKLIPAIVLLLCAVAFAPHKTRNNPPRAAPPASQTPSSQPGSSQQSPADSRPCPTKSDVRPLRPHSPSRGYFRALRRRSKSSRQTHLRRPNREHNFHATVLEPRPGHLPAACATTALRSAPNKNIISRSTKARGLKLTSGPRSSPASRRENFPARISIPRT